MKLLNRPARALTLALLALATALAFTASATAAGTRAAALPACDVNNLVLTYFGNFGDNGRLHERFRFKHRGKGRCTMRGYPSVKVLGKRKKVLPVRIRRAKGRTRKLVVAKGRPIFFTVSRPDPELKDCETRRAYWWRVQARGLSKPLNIGGFDPLRICRGGARVTPFTRNP